VSACPASCCCCCCCRADGGERYRYRNSCSICKCAGAASRDDDAIRVPSGLPNGAVEHVLPGLQHFSHKQTQLSTGRTSSVPLFLSSLVPIAFAVRLPRVFLFACIQRAIQDTRSKRYFRIHSVLDADSHIQSFAVPPRCRFAFRATSKFVSLLPELIAFED